MARIPAVHVSELSKRYGDVLAVDIVSDDALVILNGRIWRMK